MKNMFRWLLTLTFVASVSCGGSQEPVEDPSDQASGGMGLAGGESVTGEEAGSVETTDQQEVEESSEVEASAEPEPPQVPEMTDEEKAEADAMGQKSFQEAEQALQDFEKAKFEPDEDVTKTLGKIEALKARLEDLVGEYGDVLGSKSPTWSVAALYCIGYCYELFADKLRDAQYPKSLTEMSDDIKSDAIEQYDEALSEITEPFVERSKEAYEMALQVAAQSGVENEWVQKARQHLEGLDQ